MHNLSALETTLRANAADEPDLAWDLSADSTSVGVNAATKVGHADADKALADAKILLQLVEDAGFRMRVGCVSASFDEGIWRGRLIDVVLDPVD